MAAGELLELCLRFVTGIDQTVRLGWVVASAVFELAYEVVVVVLHGRIVRH